MNVSKPILLHPITINYRVVTQYLDGITHADSLKNLGYPINSYNWVLGHIIVHRDYMLALLDEAWVMSEDHHPLYKYDSDPIAKGDPCLPFEQLVAHYHASQEKLLATIEALDEAHFAAPTAPDDERSIGARLYHYCWHESYHTGQTEYLHGLLRQGD